MQYRPFGKLEFQPSALGSGAMRLPLKPDTREVDEAAAIEVLHTAFDLGVNYVDTAYGYHDGHSERIVGNAVRADGWSDKVHIATKMPGYLAQEPADLDRMFGEQLGRLGVTRIGVYMLHCLNASIWAHTRGLGAIEWLERQRAAGRIGAIGFSFHDRYEVLEAILADYDGWDFCQLQYNYVFEEVQAGTRGLQLAASKGLGVIIMEPLFGGALANPPERVTALFREAGADPVDLALRWLWDKPEVSLVLSGMATIEQVRANAASAARSAVGGLTPDERDLLARAKAEYDRLSPIPCTGCRYCMPCPHGVRIPDVFELYNNGNVYGTGPLGLNRVLYSMIPEGARADACIACGACEERCPQSIEISTWMPTVHETLAPPQPS